MDLIKEAINWVIEAIGSIISVMLSVLPDSPFQGNLYQFDNGFLKALNFVFPIGPAITHMVAFTGAVIIYYILRVVMRWIKLASS